MLQGSLPSLFTFTQIVWACPNAHAKWWPVPYIARPREAAETQKTRQNHKNFGSTQNSTIITEQPEPQYTMPPITSRDMLLRVALLLAILLPALEAKSQKEAYALVNVSVCNTRSDADYNAGQESQALMGMPVEVLDKHNEWTRIRTPEGYEHWALSSTLKELSREQLSQWNHSPQVVVTSLTTWIYSKPSTHAPTMSDAVGGNRLKLKGRKKGFYQVEYPDGRQGFVRKKDAMPLAPWRGTISRDASAILSTARSLTGIPYMWGGTSPKGVDCSGFVRTVLYLHDIIIPRNASQQAKVGLHIDIDPDYSNLQPGDLLFFGSKNADGSPKRVVHVGFSLGGKRFIHSLGCVHTGSFDPQDSDYDEYERHRLLYAVRVLPYVNQDAQIRTTDQISLYEL